MSRVTWSPSVAAGSSNDAPSTSTDPSASTASRDSTAALQIAGRVVSENPHVKMGAFHTLDLEVNRDVRIEKEGGWDSIALARVEESCVPGRGAEVAAIICGEGAFFCWDNTLLWAHGALCRYCYFLPTFSTHDGGLATTRGTSTSKIGHQLICTRKGELRRGNIGRYTKVDSGSISFL